MIPADSQAYLICLSFRNFSNLWWCIRSPSPAAWTFVLGVCTKESTSCGSNFWHNRSFTFATDFCMLKCDWPGVSWVNSSQHFATAPKKLRQFAEWIVRNKSSAFEDSALRWIVHIPPFLYKNPRFNALVARITGCPLPMKLSTVTSAVVFHFPSGLSLCVPCHLSSSLGPRNDQCPSWNLPA